MLYEFKLKKGKNIYIYTYIPFFCCYCIILFYRLTQDVERVTILTVLVSAFDKHSTVHLRDIVEQETSLPYSLRDGPVRVANGVVVQFFGVGIRFLAARYRHGVPDHYVANAGVLAIPRAVAPQWRRTGFLHQHNCTGEEGRS